MQKCPTGCRLLLIAPALFILLQVALALHHHRIESYYDNEDSLHSIPTSYYLDHIKQDTFIRLASEVLLFCPPYVWISDPASSRVSSTVPISDPRQSRAPPSSLPPDALQLLQ